jgi:hypothetical protein
LKKLGARVSSGKDSKQDYCTPADFMAAVVGRFGPITFDLAARDYFAPCTGPEGPLPFDPKAHGMDAFDHNWSQLSTNRFRRDGFMGLLWLNCEFNDIVTWAARCQEEVRRNANILLLTPASVGANWFSNLIAGDADVYLLKPRLSFIPGQTYNKDCILSHYAPPDVRVTSPFGLPDMPSLDRHYVAVWNWKTNVIEHKWIGDQKCQD